MRTRHHRPPIRQREYFGRFCVLQVERLKRQLGGAAAEPQSCMLVDTYPNMLGADERRYELIAVKK